MQCLDISDLQRALHAFISRVLTSVKSARLSRGKRRLVIKRQQLEAPFVK